MTIINKAGEIMETMTQAAIEARRQYKREWNRRNRDKVKKHQRDYWERKAATIKANTDTTSDQKGDN